MSYILQNGIDGLKPLIERYSEPIIIKMLVQEIFLKEGIQGVISFIESQMDENGNSRYPGKIIVPWLEELKMNKKEDSQQGDERE